MLATEKDLMMGEDITTMALYFSGDFGGERLPACDNCSEFSKVLMYYINDVLWICPWCAWRFLHVGQWDFSYTRFVVAKSDTSQNVQPPQL
jgi:hypothetical protein